MAQSNSQFYTEFVDTKKLTQEATQIEVPNLEATTDGKKLFTPKQWLERFRRYTKGKQNWHNRIIPENWIDADRLDQNRKSNTKRRFMGYCPLALHQMKRAKCKSEQDKIAMEYLNRLFKEYFLKKRSTYHNREDFFWTKQTEAETPEDFWRRLIEIAKERSFISITDTDHAHFAMYRNGAQHINAQRKTATLHGHAVKMISQSTRCKRHREQNESGRKWRISIAHIQNWKNQ